MYPRPTSAVSIRAEADGEPKIPMYRNWAKRYSRFKRTYFIDVQKNVICDLTIVELKQAQLKLLMGKGEFVSFIFSYFLPNVIISKIKVLKLKTLFYQGF